MYHTILSMSFFYRKINTYYKFFSGVHKMAIRTQSISIVPTCCLMIQKNIFHLTSVSTHVKMQLTTEMMLFAVAIHMDEIDCNKFIHSSFQKTFYTKLSKLQQHQRHCRIPRCALLAPKQSAWRQVYESGSDQAFTMTGVDFETFHSLEPDFKYFYDRYSPYSKYGVIVALQLNGDDGVLKG